MAFGFNALHITQVVKADEAPEIEWDKTYGESKSDSVLSVQQTSDGGYIITGDTESSGSKYAALWLIKTDANGNKEWDKIFGGDVYATNAYGQQTSDGGYILAGVTRSYGSGDNDIWLIKTDSSGNKEWDKIFGGADHDVCLSIQQTSDGGYILVGVTRSYGSGDNDIWLIKTDSSGNKEWDKTFGGAENDYASSVQQTSDGGYVIAGETWQGSSFSNGWLIKTDNNGNKEWDKTFGGGQEDFRSIKQIASGGYIILGVTWSKGTDNHDIWLVKTDSNGNKEWDKTFGGAENDYASSVQQTSDGGYVIIGSTESYGEGRKDFWVIKTDSSGNKEWDETFGGTNVDYARSVQQTSDGGYIIAGETKSFGAGDYDIWLIKVTPDGSGKQPPVADAGNDAAAYVGQSTSFEGIGSDIDGTIELYEWDFDGDGNYDWSSTTTGSTTHTYQEKETRIAKLRVTDNDGLTDTDTRIITIEGEKPTKADIVYDYYRIFYYDADQIFEDVENDITDLKNIAEKMAPSNPQDYALTILDVSTEWADFAKITIGAFNLLYEQEWKLRLQTIDSAVPYLPHIGNHIRQDDGTYKYKDSETTTSLDLDTVLLDWYNLLITEKTDEAEQFAKYVVLVRVLEAVKAIYPASTPVKEKLNDYLRQVELLLPYNSDDPGLMDFNDPDFDGLSTYYEDTAPSVALGTNPNNDDTDGDGIIDSKDIDPHHAAGNKEPGFELIFAIITIMLVLLWKRHKAK